MRDLGYQGLLVITFLGVAIAGLIYAKMIEPVLMMPPVQLEYWNFKNISPVKEVQDVNIDETSDLYELQMMNGYLE